MSAAPVRAHGKRLLDPENQHVALDPQPVLGGSLIAVQVRDLPVRGGLNKVGLRMLSQDFLAPRIGPNRRLEINGLDVDQLLGQGHKRTPDSPAQRGLSTQ